MSAARSHRGGSGGRSAPGQRSWLDEMTKAVAEAAGVDESDLHLDPDTAREILDLARIASHASGERINAPLLCYELGLAVGKGATLADLAAAVRRGDG